MTTESTPSPESSPENRELISLLLVEDNNADARVVQEALTGSTRVHFKVTRVERLAAAVTLLARESFDIILLDLTLPDGSGLDTFIKVRDSAPQTPVTVLTGLDDETLGVMAVQQGAQEYLVKADATGPLIVRCLRYALERHRMREDLRGLALTDELTGLFNRRGFTLLGRQLLKVCSRMNRPLVLLFAELENLSKINASHRGPVSGDEALRQVGTLLRRTFRDSDVLGHFDGSRFAVLAIDSPDERGLTARIEETIKDFNALRGQGEPPLHLGVGALRFSPEASQSIEDLIAQADRLRGGGASLPTA